MRNLPRRPFAPGGRRDVHHRAREQIRARGLKAAAVRAGERVAPGEARRQAQRFGPGDDAALDRPDVGDQGGGVEMGSEGSE